MADQTSKTTITDLLERLSTLYSNLYDLEKRYAQHERISAPIEWYNQLHEVRKQIDGLEADLRQLETEPLPSDLVDTIREAHYGRAQAEIVQIELLQQIHQRKLAELEKRKDMHGPSAAPLGMLRSIDSERQAIADLMARLGRAQSQLSEFATSPASEGSTTLPPKLLTVTLVTPNGERYATTVESELLVAQLQAAFLIEWQRPASKALTRYTLHAAVNAPALEPALSLAEAGVDDGTKLYWVEEALAIDSPIGLVVEGPGGGRYTASVLLNTVIHQLSDAFMATLNRSGEATVELFTGVNHQYRRLRQDATLYDERIGEGAQLRILPATS